MKKPKLETSLVVVEHGEPRTTSLLIAEGTGLTHKAVIQIVRKYENDLLDFGTLPFEMRKSGGRETEFAHLNEAQSTFLITCMRNNDVVIQFKKRLVKDYVRVKKLLQQRHNADVQQARLEGKVERRDLTDGLQQFVIYAEAQGSQSASRYYGNTTRMVYKAIGIVDQAIPGKPLRDFLSTTQLFDLAAAEKCCRRAFEEGMRRGMPYRDIYVFAKQRVEAFAAVYMPEPLKLAA